MNEKEIRDKAHEMLERLVKLNALVTSPAQKRRYKDARDYFERASDSKSESALSLGNYEFACLKRHIDEVQKGKRKGGERAKIRKMKDDET